LSRRNQLHPFVEIIAGAGVGIIGGFTSGLLGGSPGGSLVIFSCLFLGVEQHVAQGISLLAQIPPTGISGIKRYWEKGGRVSARWIIFLTIGFLIGGLGGAYAAVGVSSRILQLTFVFYLLALDAVIIIRNRSTQPEIKSTGDHASIHWIALLMVGLVAGFSSGFMGIGGGLAITVGLSSVFGVPRLQAQFVSLVLLIIPTTLPAAWVYWHEGFSTSWQIFASVIFGLWLGTDLGARFAFRVSKKSLHWMLVCFVASMAAYMAYQALWSR
jgi:uncharacterized membrane protein YfcA